MLEQNGGRTAGDHTTPPNSTSHTDSYCQAAAAGDLARERAWRAVGARPRGPAPRRGSDLLIRQKRRDQKVYAICKSYR